MKIGVFTVLFGDKPFEDTLDYVASLGLGAVEIGTGAYPGDAHCRPSELLASESMLRSFRDAVASRGLEISALSCHGNPLHPDRRIAEAHHQVFEQTVRLARALGVPRVITFSGCPGGDERATHPNWIVAPWPPEFLDRLDWQWRERVSPYWRRASAFCRDSGVRVAIEMHPNFVVYNPETMARLREVAPDVIGCNFDPSHMFWQGIDPVAAIRALGDSIYHCHAKDCRIDARNTAVNGVLDAKKYTLELQRSWIFRTVGYGNDAGTWRAIVSALRMAGYDHVLSIEHEDSLMSGDEGLRKAVAFLKEIVIAAPAGQAYWA
ncbi:MAG TPA: sugar phosphate isomerase/epimerase [Vicinamibacterales bacterium]|nr:sugar phosphate isomerase/epimerase [Vicinamibacterales bacterium]